MNQVVPVAKLGNFDEVLFINKADVPFIGKGRSIEVKCIRVDFSGKTIDKPIELEKHLKFNPWEEISEDSSREAVYKKLEEVFSESDLQNEIVKTLHAVKIVR